MKKTLIILGVLVGLNIALLAAYAVWYARVAEHDSTLVTVEHKLAEAKGELGADGRARSRAAQVAVDEATVNAYLVPEERVSSFIDDIEARGRQAGASITVTSVEKSGVGTHALLKLALSVRGGFNAVLNAIGVFEYAPYDLSIPSLTLVEEAGGVWRADVRMVVGAASPTL